MRFLRNVLFILAAITFIVLVRVMTTVSEKLCCRGKDAPSKSASVNNFMIRFLYEVSFELVLCAMINVSAMGPSEAPINDTLSFATLALAAIAALAIVCLYFKKAEKPVEEPQTHIAVDQSASNSSIADVSTIRAAS